MASWFYGKNGVQTGPVEEAELPALIASGVIQPGTLLWREGMSEWLTLRQLQASGTYLPPANPAGQVKPMPATCGYAVGSLVFGLVAFVTCMLFFGIPAVVLGHLSLQRISHAGEPVEGRGIALAGLVLGYLATAVMLALLLPLIFGLIQMLSQGRFGPP